MRTSVLVVGLVLAVAGCGRGTAVGDVKVGDCFDDTGAELVTHLEIIDCLRPHDNEVYAELQMEGDAWPGADSVESFAVSACLDRFEPYVGTSYEESRLDYFFLTPTEEGWAGGDRSVFCVLYSADLEKLTTPQKAE